MKKLLIAVVVICCSVQLKAQQLFSKPGESPLSGLSKTFPDLKSNDSILAKKSFSLPKTEPLALLAQLSKNNSNTELFYSRTPVVKIDGGSKMPTVKPGDSNMNYTMLVKKYKVVDPLAAKEAVTP